MAEVTISMYLSGKHSICQILCKFRVKKHKKISSEYPFSYASTVVLQERILKLRKASKLASSLSTSSGPTKKEFKAENKKIFLLIPIQVAFKIKNLKNNSKI